MLRSLLVQAVEKGSAEKVRRRPSTSTTPTGSPTHRFGRFGKRGPFMVCVKIQHMPPDSVFWDRGTVC